MSTLSELCDQLRARADELDWIPAPMIADDVRDAADAICELRDDLQRANAEKATLRQQLADVTVSMGRVEERCAKLRELVRDYERCSMHADCDRCEYDGKMSTHCPLSPCFLDIDELRELGVEA